MRRTGTLFRSVLAFALSSEHFFQYWVIQGGPYRGASNKSAFRPHTQRRLLWFLRIESEESIFVSGLHDVLCVAGGRCFSRTLFASIFACFRSFLKKRRMLITCQLGQTRKTQPTLNRTRLCVIASFFRGPAFPRLEGLFKASSDLLIERLWVHESFGNGRGL